jgi:hypothetical protein
MTNSKFRSKITIAQQEAMRELFKTGYGISYIARRFKCWPNTVWNHVYDLSPPRKISAKEKNQYTKNSSLTDKDVIQIRRLVNGKSYRWVEGPTRKGFLKPLVMNRVKRTTNLHPGAKPGSKQSVPSGSLKTLAKKYGVAPCTIRRWVLKGKINVLPI